MSRKPGVPRASPPREARAADLAAVSHPVSLLQARNLTISFSGVAALNDISFALAPGRILGLVGESGAGKSMLARAIAHALPPGFSVTGGALTFAGADLLSLPPRRRRALLGREIAFIPQEPMTALNPVRTIGSQVGEHLARLGVAGGARHARAVALLESVGLDEAPALLRRYPHQLSGGMCQRVLIALAFAGRPRLVVADEPTTALDVTLQARILRLLAALQAQSGTAVVFITHDLRLAARLCDEVLVLYAGRVAERGPGRLVLEAPLHPYTACLQRANPPLHGPRTVLPSLPDQPPGLGALAGLAGCVFAPRCPVAQAECATRVPALREVASGHVAACPYPQRTVLIAAAAAPLPEPPVTEGPPVLAVDGLSRVFSQGWFGGPATHAVRGVSFQVRPGEFVGLVGESGSGKSTIARMIAGLERPSAGRIVLDGTDVTAGGAAARAQRRRAVQMVFQDPQSALNPRRRVAEIVTQAMEAAGRPAAERAARAAALLAEVGLAAELGGRRPAALSGGQRQRVNIARALCVLPKLLVADEIVSGLDVSVQAQLLALLLRLRDELGFAMLFISHDLAVVRYLCARVLVMRRGEIVEAGATDAVFAAPAHAYTRELLGAVGGEAGDPGQRGASARHQA